MNNPHLSGGEHKEMDEYMMLGWNNYTIIYIYIYIEHIYTNKLKKLNTINLCCILHDYS